MTLCCPFIASNATLALKAGEWFRLDLFVIAAPDSRRYLRRLEQGRHLAGCIKSGATSGWIEDTHLLQDHRVT